MSDEQPPSPPTPLRTPGDVRALQNLALSHEALGPLLRDLALYLPRAPGYDRRVALDRVIAALRDLKQDTDETLAMCEREADLFDAAVTSVFPGRSDDGDP